MQRRSFGFWGAALDDQELARALAVAGVLAASWTGPDLAGLAAQPGWIADALRAVVERAGQGLLDWRSPLTHPGWREVVDKVPAEQFATAWPPADRAPDDLNLRFGLTPHGWESGELDPGWVARVLTSAPVGGASATLLLDRPARGGRAAHWQWPLRVGFLPDPESRRLYDEAAAPRQPDFMRSLVTLRRVGVSSASCDLLLVPLPLPRALAALLETGARAAMVVLTGRPTLRWHHARPLLDALRSHVKASLVAFAPVGDPVAWLVSFIREFSHDQPLDVALFSSAGDGRAPLVVAERRFLDGARLTARADQLLADFDRTMAAERLPEGAKVRAALEQARTGVFLHESLGASDLASVEPRARALLDQVEPRWLQSRVLALSNPSAPEPVTEFAPDSPYAIAVRVGPSDADWVSFRDPFPDQDLPEQERPHRLTVVLSEPDLLAEPQVEEILLPRAGPSTEARFLLRTRADTTAVRARLIVAFGNRVLQTALLRGNVQATAEDLSIRLEPEAVVRLHTHDLGERRRFDAALVVNRDDGGRSRADVLAGGEAMVVDLDDLDVGDAKTGIKKRFEEIVEQPQDFGDLRAEGTAELLAYLATRGSLLRGALVADALGDDLARAERLQVLAAKPDAWFPLEFCYDYPSPNPGAKPCPPGLDALAAGAATCPGPHSAEVVCPFGFWALSKVIERHAYQRVDPRRPAAGYLVSSEPTAGRDRLRLDAGTLFAASDRVDGFVAGAVERLSNDLERLTGGRTFQVLSWHDWVARVASHEPTVLLLLPHTAYEQTLEVYGLEIAAADRLWASQIVREYIRGPGDRPVLVLLLGCATADGPITYEDFPGLFRRGGAGIVVGTLPKVLGRHAAPVGGLIVRLLVECSRRGGRTFGDLMRELRRRALAEGIPMALALMAYGDADWVLEVS